MDKSNVRKVGKKREIKIRKKMGIKQEKGETVKINYIKTKRRNNEIRQREREYRVLQTKIIIRKINKHLEVWNKKKMMKLSSESQMVLTQLTPLKKHIQCQDGWTEQLK